MRDILQAKVGLAAVGVGIGLLHLPISLAFNVTITKPAERRRGPARPGSAQIIAQDAATAFGRREQQS